MIWLQVLRVGGIVSEWANKALQDGKIDAIEAGQLIDRIAKALNVECSVSVGGGEYISRRKEM